MAERWRKTNPRKRTIIPISSSSSSSEESEPESEEDSDPSSSDYSAVEEITSSSSDDDEEDEDDGEENEGNDEESMSNRVIHLLHECSDLEELTLVDCKAYLRRHGLRLSGTRAECIERIKEHWRLKDGRGEMVYPRSSFAIDCTGDVCKGDVVLFTQKVYKNFDKVTRRSSLLGKRTVAGRIVKESYGAAKQQHTFTVEVLWSKGSKKLHPLLPLLVKGRNLYKMRTLRQSWKNEKERTKVLAEKHKRGAAARHIREVRRTKAVLKRTWKKSSKNKVAKRAKHFLDSNSSKKNLRTAMEEESSVDGRGKAPAVKPKSNYSHPKVLPSGQAVLKETRKFIAPSSHTRQRNATHQPAVGESSFQPYTYPQNFNPPQSKQCHQETPCFFYSGWDSAPMRNLPTFAINSDPFFMHPSGRQEFQNYDFHPQLAERRAHLYLPGSANTRGYGTYQPSPYTSRH